MSEVTLTIDGRTVTVPAGSTLLDAARASGSEVPSICVHPATTPNALCRVCVVEVDGMGRLQPSCVVTAAEGMDVTTRSQRVERSRRTLLEMLASTVDLSQAPAIEAMIREYDADTGRFPDAEPRRAEVLDDNPMYVRDYSQCVMCWRCVQVCADDAQYTFAINFSSRGYGSQIGTFFERTIPQTTCVFCGQCVGVCPTGALTPKREWLLDRGMTPDEVTATTRTKRRRRKQR
jgi:NADH dehydrogenase/NADH:ubiquinone oxidoreductase subunit G